MDINAIKAALAAKSSTVNSNYVPEINHIDGNTALAPKPIIEPDPTNNTVPVKTEPEAPKRKRRVKAVATPEPVTTVPEMVIPDIETIIKEKLIQGRDYDLIAGCKKPSLLKAGAEKLASIFGYHASAEVIHRVEMYDKDFVSYEIAVTIKNKAGTVIAQGIGSCNSREKRYLKGDFCCQLNTVLKMAKKRAFVDALLTATGASGVFTQDIEDIG